MRHTQKNILRAFLASAIIFALSGCNTVRIEVPAGTTLEPGAIVINQAGSKAQAVSGNKAESAIEATTTPTTDLAVTPLP